ncbi:MAG: UDP-N-acetylglucosamine 1-carboxyvinyltransferase [Deltaproteobacteria bacterium]
MDKIIVEGGRRLSGEVEVSGAKNAALPLIFASLLTDRSCRLRGLPEVADIRTALGLLEHMGAQVERSGSEATIDCSRLAETEAPYDLVRTMRASFLTLGPLLARFGKARVSRPGGCAIGSRPVDVHVAAMAALGARVEEEAGYIEARSGRLRASHVILEKPSVGATENLMMAASLAEGTTRVENAAREPEITDLAKALAAMGAGISGAGSSVIEVEGVERLGGFDHDVIPDRIEAGTFLIAGAITRGELSVRGARAGDLGALLEALRASGCSVDELEGAVRVSADGPLRPVDIRTAPYPGFATDLQAQFMALMCTASGRSVITEAVFENRFMHVSELARMGADIRLSGHQAEVGGAAELAGAPVMATDLRASVCLVLAGLAAAGRTEISRVYHLDRGYERIEEKLGSVGARIERRPVQG